MKLFKSRVKKQGYDLWINSYLVVLLRLQAVTKELETEAFPLLFCPLELMLLSDKKQKANGNYKIHPLPSINTF